MLFKKLKISFYTCCLSIILMIVPINAIDVLIGGESVGIILNYDGVCITGFYKIKVDNEIIDPSNYFEINDIITSVEKKNVKTIDDLTKGKLFIYGKNIYEMSETERAHFRKENIGFIFQNFNLLDTLTVKENIIITTSESIDSFCIAFSLNFSTKNVIDICSLNPNIYAEPNIANHIRQYLNNSSDIVLGELNTYLDATCHKATNTITVNIITINFSMHLSNIFFKPDILITPP